MTKMELSQWQLNEHDQQLIDLSLVEDLGEPFCDITTNILFAEQNDIFHKRNEISQAGYNQFRAHIISKHPQPIVLCGLVVVSTILERFNQHCVVHSDYQDGQTLSPGATLLTITGPANILLMAERTILNYLQRLCAIATLTASYVNSVKETGLKILDTRKTAPGMRHLEKYAVFCGGGVNHRMGLYDAIMIKDTHIDLLGGMLPALEKLPDHHAQQIPVIVEVRDKQELAIVLKHAKNKVTRVLLDNMSPQLMSECVEMCRNSVETEASGNINLDNIKAVANSGVDFASIGKLTHSATIVDLSMKCDIVHAK
jgi:nicotinate-nucleotide pyrophosphorylase (carboxylating)